MICSKHQVEAVAVCVYCGRALCADCIGSPDASRMVCSENCAKALARQDKTLEFLLQKSLQNARASAFYCYLCGGLSAIGTVVAIFMLPIPFLILFMGGCAFALILSGFWYSRSARRQPLD